MEGRGYVKTSPLDIYMKFDEAFRRRLDPNGNTWQVISAFMDEQSEDCVRQYPSGRNSIFDYKYRFANDFGARFTSKKGGASGRETLFEYANPECDLPGLQKMIGERQIDSGRELLSLLECKEDLTPHAVWTKLFLKKMINEGAKDLDVLSFNENLDLKGLSDNFEQLLTYIMDKQPIELCYKSFHSKCEVKKVHPYYLKMYNQRWFLVGLTLNEHRDETHPDEYYENYSFYALDRIEPLMANDGYTKRPAIRPWKGVAFRPSDEDFEDYFSDIVGVTPSPDGPQEVLLRFSLERFDYVRTKPIVGTQKIVKPGDVYYNAAFPTIKLKVHINRELVQRLLSFGEDLEVLAPDTLRETMAEKISLMAQKYQK
jgi:hypothetical protein